MFNTNISPFSYGGKQHMQKVKINVRKRENGSYEARIVIDGKRYSRYGKSISDVKQKARKLQLEAEKGNVIAMTAKLDVALEAYLQDIKKCKVKATTYDRAESTFITHIKNEPLARMQVGVVTAQNIQKLLSDKCKEGLSVSSIKKIFNLLGEFYRYVFAIREINYNPMDLVKMPHMSNNLYQSKEMEVLTVEELKNLVSVAEQIKGSGQPKFRYGEAVILLLNTGLRSGELRGINKKDIDFERRVLHVQQNVVYVKDRENGGIQYLIDSVKTTKSNREIPLNDRALLSLRRLLETTCNHETGYLLCTTKGKIVTHSNLQRGYSVILAEAGIEHMGLHSTRHTFATVVLKNAEDKGQIKEVSELLGHSQVSTTYTYYIKASDTEKRNLMNQLNSLVTNVG